MEGCPKAWSALISGAWGNSISNFRNSGYFVDQDTAQQRAIIFAETERQAQVKQSTQNPVGIWKQLAVKISPVPVR